MEAGSESNPPSLPPDSLPRGDRQPRQGTPRTRMKAMACIQESGRDDDVVEGPGTFPAGGVSFRGPARAYPVNSWIHFAVPYTPRGSQHLRGARPASPGAKTSRATPTNIRRAVRPQLEGFAYCFHFHFLPLLLFSTSRVRKNPALHRTRATARDQCLPLVTIRRGRRTTKWLIPGLQNTPFCPFMRAGRPFIHHLEACSQTLSAPTLNGVLVSRFLHLVPPPRIIQSRALSPIEG